MKYASLLASVFAVILGGVYLLTAMSAPSEAANAPHYQEAGKILVQAGGRLKPLDTLARTSLTILNHRDAYRDDEGNKVSAIHWLLDVMTSDLRQKGDGESQKVRGFRIDDPRLRELLALPANDDSLYSFQEFSGKAENLLAQALKIKEVPPKDWSDFDHKVLELTAQYLLYSENAPIATPYRVFRIENDQVLNLLLLERREGLRYSFDEFVPRIALLEKEAMRAHRTPGKEQTVYDAKLLELAGHVKLYQSLARREGETLQMIPPANAGGEWKSTNDGVREIQAGAHNPLALGFVETIRKYVNGKPEEFNKETDSYLKLQSSRFPKDAATAKFEVFFNQFAPFYHCFILYVFVLVLALLSLFPGLRILGWAAFGLAALTLLVHTWAICGRMYIQGRPPVTNLYSSAVFIGWGCVLLCLIIAVVVRLAYRFPPGLACLVAAALGFPTLLIAHFLSLSGDTLEMMQAVLDTNFWLATHVTCVTLGYTATFVAGGFGIALLIVLAIEPLVGRPMVKLVGQMTYGVVCFATLLSFTGTVLGGIWADQSWGRFWGWDPKENGALLIVVWNALILHARWGGMIKERGMAVLTLGGNMITAWSWFGTNQLGVGLHAYGFNNKLATGCAVFWVSQLVLIAVGALVPPRLWHRLFARPPVIPLDVAEKAPRPTGPRATGDGHIGLNPTA